MSAKRKNWTEGFALGILIGVVATVSLLAGRPAPRQIARSAEPQPISPPLLRDDRIARLMAAEPSPTVH
jgi:hypothetical protein